MTQEVDRFGVILGPRQPGIAQDVLLVRIRPKTPASERLRTAARMISGRLRGETPGPFGFPLAAVLTAREWKDLGLVPQIPWARVCGDIDSDPTYVPIRDEYMLFSGTTPWRTQKPEVPVHAVEDPRPKGLLPVSGHFNVGWWTLQSEKEPRFFTARTGSGSECLLCGEADGPLWHVGELPEAIGLLSEGEEDRCESSSWETGPEIVEMSWAVGPGRVPTLRLAVRGTGTDPDVWISMWKKIRDILLVDLRCLIPMPVMDAFVVLSRRFPEPVQWCFPPIHLVVQAM